MREVTPPPRENLAEAALNIRRIGGRLHPLRDLFHTLMTASWPVMIGFIFAIYMTLNVLFACVYLALGDGIDHATHGSFEDAFFFSVQTLATIGYGGMTPHGTLANAVVTVESFTGTVAAALTTGLVFAKFSRPTSRILFTRTALVGTVDGKRVLMFRIANERSNRIMEASVHVALTRNETTREGQPFRRIYDLKLQRDTSAMFVLTWMVFHTIDESSPLWGVDLAKLKEVQASLIVSLVGTDETLSQQVHARHAYDWQAIVFDARFVDVLRMEDGARVLDFDRFHTYTIEHDEPG